jgi:hypothetical protein
MTDPTPLDITNIPEFLRLVEELRASQQPRLLKQNRESVAMLMPLGTTLKQQPTATQEDIWANYDAGKMRTALAQSAKTMEEVNRVTLLTDVRNERS